MNSSDNRFFGDSRQGFSTEQPCPRLCGRCGHSSDDHRLDDALNLGPCDEGAKFRCTISYFKKIAVTVRAPRNGGVDDLIEVDCNCPDFMEASP